jgi:plasmid stabilization system protein ParE
MKYRIAITANAKADIREAARWLLQQTSPAIAERWLVGPYRAIDSLNSHPRRCPLAAESDKFPVEIRELLHGKTKSAKHRILFRVDEDIMSILYVRHTARDELEP